MDGTTNDEAEERTRGVRGSERHATDVPGLVSRLHQGDDDAVVELYARYLPFLLSLARQLRVPPWDRRELALDVIAQAAMQLRRPGATSTRALGGLLATTLRRRVVDQRRRDAARVPVVPIDDLRDGELAGAADAAAEPGALSRLADHLEGHVDETELHILHWLGERVPQRVIADWLGVSHGAMRMRIARLRERLREVVRTWCLAVDERSHEEVARFFSRYAAPFTQASTRSPGRAPGGRRHGSPT